MCSGPPMVFDLEGHSTKDDKKLDLVNERYAHPNKRHCGNPGLYTRVAGADVAGVGYFYTHNIPSFAQLVGASALACGHNIVSFDLPVLDRDVPGAIDILDMARHRRILDTMITEAVLDPPENDDMPNAVQRAMQRYGLQAVCERRGLPGKEDWKGDFCRVPLNDPEYLAYLQQDVAATKALAAAQMAAGPLPEYVWREHRVQAIGAMMSAAGVEADQELLQRRYWLTHGRKATLARKLVKRYGLPMTKSDGKPAESPHATKEGKAALVRAFESLGVPEHALPRTAPSKTYPAGQYSFSSDSMNDLAAHYGGEVAELCEVVADLAGQRTVYSTALEHLHDDGAVHPSNTMFQASGRWSVTKPGMTVFGKRGGRVRERAIFKAREGHVLIPFDLAQIDMRAVAAHCQDPAYIDIFVSGRDLHSEIAARLWGGPDRGNPYREKAKPAGHGWNYGMQPDKMAASAGISLADANAFDLIMKSMFPQLNAWRDYVRNVASATGRLDNGFGRIMRCNPRRAFTQAPALMGQGTARDLMMEVMLRLPDEVARMLRILVHDEIVLEVPERDVAEVIDLVLKTAAFEWCPPGASIPVPIMAEASKPGRNWAECYRK